MKAVALLVSALAATCLPLQTAAQENPSQEVVNGASMTLPVCGNQGDAAILALSKTPRGTLTNRFAFRAPSTRPPQVIRPLRPQLPVAGQLAPGVYETKPYACIVVVPGPHRDDRFFARRPRGDTGEFKMPTIKPELRFIPRKR